jgi:hypothetical protein
VWLCDTGYEDDVGARTDFVVVSAGHYTADEIRNYTDRHPGAQAVSPLLVEEGISSIVDIAATLGAYVAQWQCFVVFHQFAPGSLVSRPRFCVLVA